MPLYAALLLAPSVAPITVSATKTLVGVRAIAIAAAPTGNKFAVSTEDNKIRIIDAATRQTIKTLTGHPQNAKAIAWSPDGKWIASGDESARIYIWKTANWSKAFEGRPHTRGIQNLAFNSKSTLLLSTGNDDMIKVFSLGSFKKPLVEIPGKGMNVYSAAFSPTGGIIAATLTNGAKLFTSKGALVSTYLAHDNLGCLDVALNPSGSRVLSAGKDGRVALFDFKTSKRLGYYKGHGDWVLNAIYTPNGKHIVSTSTDMKIRIWNPFNFATEATIQDASLVGSPLAITGTGLYLATTDSSDNLRIHTLSPAQK